MKFLARKTLFLLSIILSISLLSFSQPAATTASYSAASIDVTTRSGPQLTVPQTITVPNELDHLPIGPLSEYLALTPARYHSRTGYMLSNKQSRELYKCQKSLLKTNPSFRKPANYDPFWSDVLLRAFCFLGGKPYYKK